MLNSILKGNILSMAKYLKYWIQSKIVVESTLFPKCINYKNQKMLGFKGIFKTNFVIPDNLGLGKSVSKGYGTIQKV